MQDLYKLQPTAKTAIQKAAGCAVFSNMGTNILVLSTARGVGIAVNQKTKQQTFMKMISAGAGLGMGVKGLSRGLHVRGWQSVYKISGFRMGSFGTGRRRGKAGKSGGAYSGAAEVAPGVYVYQITKNGLALQLTVAGTKYYEDDDLNNPKKT